MQAPLILSAAPFEASPLLDELSLRGQSFEYMPVGIGCLEAAQNSVDVGLRAAGRDVIFLGTCGVFEKFTAPFLLTVNRVLWLPYCERVGFSQSIEGLTPPITLNASPLVQDLPSYTLLCAPNISLNASIDENIRATQKLHSGQRLAENIELYTILRSVLPNARSITICLAATNSIGPNGRLEWRQYFKQAAHISAQFLLGKFTSTPA